MGERGRKEGEGSEERRGKERGGEERASPLFISSAAPATLSTVFVALSTVFSSSSYSLVCAFMSPLGDIYAFASWQNRHFGGVFRP